MCRPRANGLDPEGIRWIRELLRGLAAEGRTVLLSSHLMTEMALTAEHLVVVGRGRLLGDMSVAELVARSATSIRVRSPHAAQLGAVLAGRDVTVTIRSDGALEVTGLSARQIGDCAAGAGLTVHELVLQQASLEEAYMELTADAVEYHGLATATSTPTPDRKAA